MSDYTIIVPAFNEERGLPTVLDELTRTCPGAEIVVVDDGSTDGTARVAEAFPVEVVSHPINRGYGAALKRGIARAKHERLVFFDGDGQHDPAYIPAMVRLLDEADLVIGERPGFAQRSLVHRAGRLALSWLVNVLSQMRIHDINCGLRAARRSVLVRYLRLLPDGFSFSTTSTVAFANARRAVAVVPVEVRPRIGRTSGVRLVRDGYNTLLLVIRLIALFAPLRVFLPPAFFLMAFGMTYGLFKYVTLPVYTGLSVGALSFFLTGLIVFFLGVVCDQVAALRLDGFRDDE